MTITEIKQGIKQSSPEERAYLSAFLKHLARKDDPAYRAELTRLNREFDEGKKFSLEQVKWLQEVLPSSL